MGEASAEKAKEGWTTGEELLLACAVKRHGSNNWESVAMELQTRSCLSSILTPNHCRQKYTDLQRRFNQDQDQEQSASDIPWLDQLRQRRVAELREEVHRYDVSILSLQSKVKRLKEGRQQSSQGNENDVDEEPDLKDLEAEDAPKPPPESAGNSASNQSFNESNSTGRRGDAGLKAAPSEDAEKEPPRTEPDPPPADRPNQGDENSYNTEANKNESVEGEETDTKESSDVQSSASLTRKKRRMHPEKRVVAGGGAVCSGEEPESDDFCGGCGDGGGAVKAVLSGSDPLVPLLRRIASHKQSSLFGARFRNQDTVEFKSRIIRQHLDLDAVQARLRQGSYATFARMFFRDLLLLFTNFIVCSPAASPESVAAHELRCLVYNELKKQIPTPFLPADDVPPPPPPTPAPPEREQSKPELGMPNSLLAKHKSSAPIVVCRKRSSLTSAKTSAVSALPKKVEAQRDDKEPTAALELRPSTNSNSSLRFDDDDDGSYDEEQNNFRMKERLATGVRSSRSSKHPRANNNHIITATKQSSRSPKLEAADSAAENKTPEAEGLKRKKKKTADSKLGASAKKRGAADFLKRIKLNTTPSMKGAIRDDLISGRERSKTRGQASGMLDCETGGGSMLTRGGKRSKEDDSPSKRCVGRPPKKSADSTTLPKGKGAEKEAVGASNRRGKRSRR